MLYTENAMFKKAKIDVVEFLKIFGLISVFGIIAVYFAWKFAKLKEETLIMSLEPEALEALYLSGEHIPIERLCYGYGGICNGKLWCSKKVAKYCKMAYKKNNDLKALDFLIKAEAVLVMHNATSIDCLLELIENSQRYERLLLGDAAFYAVIRECLSERKINFASCEKGLKKLKELKEKMQRCLRTTDKEKGLFAPMCLDRLRQSLIERIQKLNKDLAILGHSQESGFCPRLVLEHIVNDYELKVPCQLDGIYREIIRRQTRIARRFAEEVEKYQRAIGSP